MKNLIILSCSLLVMSLGQYAPVAAHQCVYPAYYTTYESCPRQVVYQEPVYVEQVPVVEYVRPVYVRPYRRYCRPQYRGYCSPRPRAALSFSFGF